MKKSKSNIEKSSELLDKSGFISVLDGENKNKFKRIVVCGKKGSGKTHKIDGLLDSLGESPRRVDFSSLNISNSDSLKNEITGNSNFLKTFLLSIALISLPLLTILINSWSWWFLLIISIPQFIYIFLTILLCWDFWSKDYIVFENMNRIKNDSDVYTAIEIIEKIPSLSYLKSKNIIFETDEDVTEIIDSKYITHFYEIDRNASEIASDAIKSLESDYKIFATADFLPLFTIIAKKYEMNIRKIKSAFVTSIRKFEINRKLFKNSNLSFKDYFYTVEVLIYLGNISEMTPTQILNQNMYTNISRGAINGEDYHKLSTSQEDLIKKQAPWAVEDKGEFALISDISYYFIDKSVKFGEKLILTIYNICTNRFEYSDTRIEIESIMLIAKDHEKQNGVFSFYEDDDFEKFFELIFKKENWSLAIQFIDYATNFKNEAVLYKKWGTIEKKLFEYELSCIENESLKHFSEDGNINSEWARKYIEGGIHYPLSSSMIRQLYYQNKTPKQSAEILSELIENYPEKASNLVLTGTQTDNWGSHYLINVERFMGATSFGEDESKMWLKKIAEKLDFESKPILVTTYLSENSIIGESNISLTTYVNSDISLFKKTNLEKELMKVFPQKENELSEYYVRYKNNRQIIFFRYITNNERLDNLKELLKNSDVLKGENILFNKSDSVCRFENEFELEFD